MRKTQIAEWILSLVTSPERAASTIGDLMEDGATRNALWFWMCVGRTALSSLWRTFVPGWPRLIALAGLGVLLEFLGMIAVFVIPGLVSATLTGMSIPSGHPVLFSAVLTPARLLFIWNAGFACVDFGVSWWMARRSPKQEFAACVALIAAGLVTSAATRMAFEIHRTGRTDLLTYLALPGLSFLWNCVLVLTAAALVRWRRIAG
jgi:hypothetical protein